MSTRTRCLLRLLAAACAVVGCSVAAGAAEGDTRYVSINGQNSNACTLAAPCRSLQRGINRTPAGGELRILDTGNYGNKATVGKSLTISGNGNTVYLGTDISINNPDAVVTLRGLVLNGRGAVVHGIDIDAARAVHIERCVIHNFTGAGIDVGADDVKLFILDSISRDNGSHGFNIGFAGASRVTIDGSRFENNGLTGVRIRSGDAAISRSVVSGNQRGIEVADASIHVVSTMAVQNANSGLVVNGDGFMRIDSSTAADNGLALSVAAGGTAVLSQSTLSGVSAVVNSGTALTLQNNMIGGAILGSLTPLVPQ